MGAVFEPAPIGVGHHFAHLGASGKWQVASGHRKPRPKTKTENQDERMTIVPTSPTTPQQDKMDWKLFFCRIASEAQQCFFRLCFLF